MDAWLSRMGVQPRPYRALVRAFLTMDLKGQFYEMSTGSKANDLVAPLYWVYGQLLIASALSCAIMQGRVDVGFYAFFNLSLAAILTWSAVIVEFHEAAYDPKDITVVGHRPITSRTWAFARLSNLLAYVSFISLALTIFPAVMGLGLNDAGPLWILTYPFASAFACGSGAALALLTFAVAGLENPLSGPRRIASWIQIVLILVLFYGGQLMIRSTSGIFEYFAAKPPVELTYLPTWYLGQAVANNELTPLAVGAILTIALCGIAIGAMRRGWNRVSHTRFSDQKITIRNKVPGTLANPISSAIWGREASMYAKFAHIMLTRDNALKARNLPSLSMAIASPILGMLTNQYTDPMAGWATNTVLPIVTFGLLATAVPSIVHHCRFSNDHEAAWRLRQSWNSNSRTGVKNALMSHYFLPFSLLHGIAVGIFWANPTSALLHTAVGLAMLDLIVRLCTIMVLKSPIFSLPMSRGSTMGSINLTIAAISVLSSALCGVWFVVSANPVGVLSLAIGFAATSRFIGWLDRRNLWIK